MISWKSEKADRVRQTNGLAALLTRSANQSAVVALTMPVNIRRVLLVRTNFGQVDFRRDRPVVLAPSSSRKKAERVQPKNDRD
jgi:hypothetical protein